MTTKMETTQTDNKYLVTFSKPHSFEGKEYTELDLSGLEDITTRQLADISKHFSTTEYITPRPEADLQYCCMVAAEILHLPKQFFDGLPAKQGMKVRDVVQGFFQAED